MPLTTSLPSGVRRLPSGRYQARYAGRTLGTFADPDEAILRRKQAELDGKHGRRPRRGRRTDPALAAATDVYLARRKRDRELGLIAASTFAQLAKELRPWRPDNPWTALDLDGFPICASRISQLATIDVDGWYQERRGQAPEQARKELFALKAVLRDTARFGTVFEPGLLTISPGKRSRRVGRALPVDQLEYLALAFPARLRTLPLFVGTVGLRISEALGLERERVDLRAGTVFVPAAECKERRDKTIPLLPEETALLDEQLGLHDHPYVWPRPRGGRWPHWSFHGKVWQPALETASAAWAAAGGAAGLFDGLRPHDLRHTAATLMRRIGVDADLAALRLGHADAGWLLMTLYNHPDPEELQAELAAVAGHGIRSGLTAPVAANVVPITATGGRRSLTSATPRSPRRAARGA